jgi:hypothetical protein
MTDYSNLANARAKKALINLPSVSYTDSGVQNAIKTSGLHQGNQEISQRISAITDYNNEVSNNLSNTVGTYATLNEVVNANQMIHRLLKKEFKYVETHDNNVRQQQYLLRDKLFMYHYIDRYYHSVTRAICVTLLVTVILTAVVSLWKIGLVHTVIFWTLVAAVGLLFLLVMMNYAANIANRKVGDWSRKDWKKQMKKDE